MSNFLPCHHGLTNHLLWTQFEKILVLALKERYDKRDAMILSSSLTGFDVEFIDGIRGEDIAPKALPPVLQPPCHLDISSYG
jgi:hypothetical protein